MIGVIVPPERARAVEELFELFKTPWEPYRPDQPCDVLIAVGAAPPAAAAKMRIVFASASPHAATAGAPQEAVRPAAMLHSGEVGIPLYRGVRPIAPVRGAEIWAEADGQPAVVAERTADGLTVRVGFDLFAEVEWLLDHGQPPAQADHPTLDLHIALLRSWLLKGGIGFVEIPPQPHGRDFTVCLTHDIDFVGIRRHKLDHTVAGFLYRALFGSIARACRGRLTLRGLLRNWWAAASLPFVYLGWVKDFWEPFNWYLAAERGLPATYFLIPFPGRPGDRLAGRAGRRRAAAYDVSTMTAELAALTGAGNEIGVHGIDAWHDAARGREESSRIAAAAAAAPRGIRMHWLLWDAGAPDALERAGYAYDSTCGYNETIGYRAGTALVFRPLQAAHLLELPMHIQDGALFYPKRLNLTAGEAMRRCQAITRHARERGGVVTLLWHDRSHAPERQWGAFYVDLVRSLRAENAWFATAAQATAWFDRRRAARFERAAGGAVRLAPLAEPAEPALRIRRHVPGAGAGRVEEQAWAGSEALCLPPEPAGSTHDTASRAIEVAL